MLAPSALERAGGRTKEKEAAGVFCRRLQKGRRERSRGKMWPVGGREKPEAEGKEPKGRS